VRYMSIAISGGNGDGRNDDVAWLNNSLERSDY